MKYDEVMKTIPILACASDQDGVGSHFLFPDLLKFGTLTGGIGGCGRLQISNIFPISIFYHRNGMMPNE